MSSLIALIESGEGGPIRLELIERDKAARHVARLVGEWEPGNPEPLGIKDMIAGERVDLGVIQHLNVKNYIARGWYRKIELPSYMERPTEVVNARTHARKLITMRRQAGG